MNINVKVIPHHKQRYATCGDYFYRKNVVHFRISDTGNNRYNFLILLHELVEWFLVELSGISIDDIDSFDKGFEEEREAGLHKEDEEPGDDRQAPYYREHQIATKIEKMMARIMRVNWSKYEATINNL